MSKCVGLSFWDHNDSTLAPSGFAVHGEGRVHEAMTVAYAFNDTVRG